VPTFTLVARPMAPIAISSQPNGPTVGTLPTNFLGGSTWVPVWQETSGWYQIGMPQGGEGWVRMSGVQVAVDPYYVTVNLSSRQLTAYENGRSVGTWPAAIGAPQTPTPALRTFITADIEAIGSDAVEAPLIRPLAVKGNPLARAELGSDAVVAIHGWEDQQTDPALWDGLHGLPITHGCIRVPADAMTGVMSQVPNGTPVVLQ
jgi:lipoprotein-anchoring transpeptidase ErfK/SrfK